MLVTDSRPRNLRWIHAGPLLYGDWGTSRLYVLGLAFLYTAHASVVYLAAIGLLMLAVSLASTCAFMTPVATPVNALAFGGIGGVSLGRFMKNGLLMNLLSAVWIAAWITWIIPPVLGWFGYAGK